MPFNVGTLSELMELYAGKAGVTKDRLNPVLVRQVILHKLRDFASRAHVLESKATIESVADQQEYELPSDVIHIKEVHFDGARATKIIYEQEAEISEEIS